ncbi:MAG: AbrB/MazE/SpoVT family DNA-binding domain-containing protein [Nitrosomonadales bacterium]|nr:AbrB/MazE/SpoVT family DNA-binding domain-containing protein [Nitrosomonadales bacterium]
MSTATLSSNFQISLPEELRETMHLQPGQEFELIPMGSIIQMIPKKSVEELRSAIAAGIASGQGRPADEAFDRLEAKYRNMTKE